MESTAADHEIARGVVFLCDPASEYMSVATLLIDGGALSSLDHLFRITDPTHQASV